MTVARAAIARLRYSARSGDWSTASSGSGVTTTTLSTFGILHESGADQDTDGDGQAERVTGRPDGPGDERLTVDDPGQRFGDQRRLVVAELPVGSAPERRERERQLDQAGHLGDRDRGAAAVDDMKVGRLGAGVLEGSVDELVAERHRVDVGDHERRRVHQRPRPRTARMSSSGVIAKGFRRSVGGSVDGPGDGAGGSSAPRGFRPIRASWASRSAGVSWS
jgi:hypothetical protein